MLIINFYHYVSNTIYCVNFMIRWHISYDDEIIPDCLLHLWKPWNLKLLYNRSTLRFIIHTMYVYLILYISQRCAIKLLNTWMCFNILSMYTRDWHTNFELLHLSVVLKNIIITFIKEKRKHGHTDDWIPYLYRLFPFDEF